MTQKNNITISIDCMGGDDNVSDIISGVNDYYIENKTDLFLLHGDKSKIDPHLNKYKQLIKIVHYYTQKNQLRWMISLLKQ